MRAQQRALNTDVTFPSDVALKVLRLQYIEEPTSSWEDGLRLFQETGVPIALDETLDAAMQAPQARHALTCLSALPARSRQLLGFC